MENTNGSGEPQEKRDPQSQGSSVRSSNSVSKLLKRWRKMNGLTPKKASRLWGMEPQQWRDYERGKAPLPHIEAAFWALCAGMEKPRVVRPSDFANKLLHWRNWRSMTQERAAAYLKVRYGTYRQWESGACYPNRANLKSLEAMGVINKKDLWTENQFRTLTRKLNSRERLVVAEVMRTILDSKNLFDEVDSEAPG